MSASRSGFDLDAKYIRLDGEILLTGVQALVRVVFDQVRADRRRGLRTAAFVSGYPGSPLGGFDQALARTGPLLDEHDVRWVPGINEELAAAAVWGSQQDNLAPLAQHDGVVGLWYGKAPGVDRSGDAFRHGNLHGAGRNGGVLVAAGDDPASKSSTLPNSSQVALYDAGMPVLAAGNTQEVLDLGLHGFALSRYSGLWASLKMVTAVCDGFGAATVSPDRIRSVQPELSFDGRPWRHVQRPKLFLPARSNWRGSYSTSAPRRPRPTPGRTGSTWSRWTRLAHGCASCPTATPTGRSARPSPSWGWPTTTTCARPASGWSGSE